MRHIRDESIVTGEAVELEVRPASPLLRMAAGVVDGTVAVMVTVLLAVLGSRVLPPPSASMERVEVIGLVVMVTVLIPLATEVATGGRSLGKWAFGIQVVRDDGGPVTARHTLVRALAGVVELWVTVGSLALVTSLVAPRSKRLGDLAAGTMVVRLPEPRWYAPLLMPPDLAAWASVAQILQPPQGLQAEALAYLRSNSHTAPTVRVRAATSLASRLRVHVAPAPPLGTDPERFIAAVLVVLRDREYARLLDEQATGARRRAAVDAAPFGI